MNYLRFCNRVSLARKPSAIRATAEILALASPSMISLAPGFPNPELVPFKTAEFALADGSSLQLDAADVSKALQYGPSYGLPEFVKWLREFVNTYHKPPTMDLPKEEGGLDLMVTVGDADGLSKAFDMLLSEGDSILLDSPTYAGTLSALIPKGVHCIDVVTDEYGMRPDALQAALSKWSKVDFSKPTSSAPKVLYTVPNGSNPTGASMTLERKRSIYEIAQAYDLLIMEDDPYYFLQFSQVKVPSFLSLDTDGRVLRFDSFSKVISAGIRLGFVSGPQPLVNRMMLHQQCSNVHCSSLSQMLVLRLLQQWGEQRFEQHVQEIVAFYKQQKDLMIDACTKHLTGLAEWREPQAGMFLWIKLLGIEDTYDLIKTKALEKEVLFVPGLAFYATPDLKTPYIRASFSIATAAEIDEGIRRLADLIRSSQ